MQAEVCGLQIADADPKYLLDPRIDSKQIFLFRGRDVAVTMNGVKILHAVRSAITAIAELLVCTMQVGYSYLLTFYLLKNVIGSL